ncbi:MAG: hypothetical protein HC814_04815 [Rhodobacteraceae bacterium]|nr:hypothetical protein [Paracoccaceae bacterium]
MTPDHNKTYPPASAPTDTIPDEAKVEMIVETEEVPDGTTATITVKHCKSGSAVKDGTVGDLEIKGNKVVAKANWKTAGVGVSTAAHPLGSLQCALLSVCGDGRL